MKSKQNKKSTSISILNGQGIWIDSDKLNKDDYIREVLKHGTLSIGFIGLAECLKALTGFHHGESEEIPRKLDSEIVQHMRRRMDDVSSQYNMNFTL